MAHPAKGISLLMVIPESFPTKLYEEKLLSRHIRSDFVFDAAKAIEHLDQSGIIGLLPDLLVIALEVGQHNGLELIHEIRSQRDWQKISILLVTMSNNQLLGLDNDTLEGYGVIDVLDFRELSPDRLAEIAKQQIRI